ncbi:hypothetical protein PFISCL1PPCAC_447, partial [Pristionchus fissidentatus]
SGRNQREINSKAHQKSNRGEIKGALHQRCQWGDDSCRDGVGTAASTAAVRASSEERRFFVRNGVDAGRQAWQFYAMEKQWMDVKKRKKRKK